MATKRQLRERWKKEPGATIWKKIVDYIRSTHKWRADATAKANSESQTLDSSIVFGLLDGLPYREEVPNGRDLRGASLASGWASDFSETDFSYSGPGIGNFFHCDLRQSRFDEASAAHVSFHVKLTGATFYKAKLQSCHFTESDARSCCFDAANLYHTTFKNANLSGSSFSRANCKMVSFGGADLRGCDFRGANLEEAVFNETKIDKSTDFRGASLVNAYHSDSFDRAGNLTGHGVDLKQATYDESTKFGKHKLLENVGIWDAIIEVARWPDYGEDGAAIAAAMQAVKARQLRDGYSNDWREQLYAVLTERQRQLYDDDLEENAYKSLL
jgi:uncharacterized protein YjbI with pentapeptide repeats